jgi:chromosome segregation ATPase
MNEQTSQLLNLIVLAIMTLLYGRLRKNLKDDVQKHTQTLIDEPVREVKEAVVSVKQYTQVFESFNATLLTVMESHKISTATLQEMNDALKSEVKGRDTQHVKDRESYNNLESQYKTVVNRLNETSETLADVVTKQEERDREVSALRGQLTKMGDEVTTEKESSAKTRQELTETQRQLDEAKLQIKALDDQLSRENAASTERERELQTQLTTERKKVSELETKVKTLEDEVKRLTELNEARPVAVAVEVQTPTADTQNSAQTANSGG